MNLAAAAGLVLAPTVFRIGFAQGGHIGRCAAGFVDGQPVEVAAIPQLPAADEGRLPLRQKAPATLNRNQPVEEGVHQPVAVAAPGQVMAHQRAAVVTGAGKESDVVLALGLDAGRDLPVGRQAPDRIPRAHGDGAGGAEHANSLI